MRRILLGLSVLVPFGLLGQNAPKALISIKGGHLTSKMDNNIRIVAQQDRPVSSDQLKGTIQAFNSVKKPLQIVEKKGYFTIRPDTTGLVEISVNLGDTIEVKRLYVRPMTAVGQLGSYRANEGAGIGSGEFKAQSGILAVLQGYDIDALCRVLEFQVVRISEDNQVERATNLGPRFESGSRQIIDNAKPGDLYLFINVLYKCFNSTSPQKLDDMVVTIRK